MSLKCLRAPTPFRREGENYKGFSTDHKDVFDTTDLYSVFEMSSGSHYNLQVHFVRSTTM